MGPAELLRRFFEIIASGVLLPGEMGIYDPCEKDKANAAQNVKLQDCQVEQILKVQLSINLS